MSEETHFLGTELVVRTPDQRTRHYCEADHLAGLLVDGYHHDC